MEKKTRTRRWLGPVLLSLTLMVGCGATDAGDGFTVAGDTSTGGDATVGDDTNTGGDTTIDPGDTQVTQPDVPTIPDTPDPGLPDEDGDTIPDEVEGSASGRDSDGDGIPDYQDPDSDNDGINDVDEAGDDRTDTEPYDSDSDGTPDYLDEDSDDNGIIDALEGTDDPDNDGIPNYRDFDNDNDNIIDLEEINGGGADCDGNGSPDPAGSPSSPRNCVASTPPDYLNVDTDGDTIADRIESTRDTDGDGFLDRYDADSDNDGLTDRSEAGDGDVNTPPRDTDGDGNPDFRDPDSDDDGLSDANEVASGTNPYAADSDGDGVSDLIEQAAGTNPIDSNDNPQANGDFVFLVPYQVSPTPDVDTLAFRTNFQQADAYFLFDVTGSMDDEIKAVQEAVDTIINNLTCQDFGLRCVLDSDCGVSQACSVDGRCIEDPAITGCIPSFATGTGYFGDDDRNIVNDRSITTNSTQARQDVRAICRSGHAAYGGSGTVDCSYGADEPVFRAAACMANPTHSSCTGNSGWRMAGCSSSGIGCPGFRPDAIRILLEITDADDQCNSNGPCWDGNSAGTQLRNQKIFFVGINACDGSTCDGSGPQTDLSNIARGSGSLDKNNNPFVRSGDPSVIVNGVEGAIKEIVNEVPIDVTIEAVDMPGDAGDAIQFIEALEVNVSGADINGDNITDCQPISNTADLGWGPPRSVDGRNDAFPGLKPGSRVCWDVDPIFNDFVPATDEPQLFEAELTVRGDGAILDKRRVFFLIAPNPIIIQN